MHELYNKLIKLLKLDSRLVSDDKLLKNKVVELAYKLDKELLKSLMGDKEFRDLFFIDVEDTLVFDQLKFQKFISNKEFLPDSYTAFKNKIGLTVDDSYLSEENDVVLSFPYKDCVLEGGQDKEDAKRDEIFYNELLAHDAIDRLLEPKVMCGFTHYNADSKSAVKDINPESSLIIKGNNLLVVSSLRKQFLGKIKLIYIDPPYNTPGDGNTFIYNNTFNHSTWLTFMKNRISVSKELLREDGVMAIAIDEIEYAYLKVLCDEVFGRDSFMGTVIVQSKPSGRTTDTYFATSHEYVLFYSKVPNKPEINFFKLNEEQASAYTEGDDGEKYKWRDFLRTGGYSTPEERPNSYYPIYFNPSTEEISLDNKKGFVEILPLDSQGKKRVWRKIPESFSKHLEKNEIKVVKDSQGNWKIKLIDPIKEGIRPKTMWVESKYDASSHGTKLLKTIFKGEKVFSYPKSLHAVKDVIDIVTERGGDDIVLDFFAGSGTTAHAVMELNKEDEGARRFILVEQMDYVDSVTTKRVVEVIKDIKEESFIRMDLLDANSYFVNHIDGKNNIEMLKKIKSNGFITHKVDLDKLTEEEFSKLSKEEQKKLLLEILDKNHLYVNLEDIDDERFGISDEVKRLNKQFYGI